MIGKSQFQNLVLRQTLQERAEQPSMTIQPTITLPIRSEAMVAQSSTMLSPSSLPPVSGMGDEVTLQGMGGLASSAALAVPEIPAIPTTPEIQEEIGKVESVVIGGIEGVEMQGAELPPLALPPSRRKKKHLLRGAVILLSLLLFLAIYLTWRAAAPLPASPTITQPMYGTPMETPRSSFTGTLMTPSVTTNDGTIQVYITGAIKRPGVYTLSADARVYQLIQAAGGVLPNADLVSLNLAAGLTDGQEIYVLSIGETPPASVGNPSSTGNTTGGHNTGSSGTPAGTVSLPVNINTATEDEMKQALHVSSSTAQKIIAYRMQHGRYTSVDQLLQVVSKSIYDRIKNMVTV